MTNPSSVRSLDITDAWLTHALLAGGYSVEADLLLADPSVTVLAVRRHDRAVFALSIRPNLNLIAVTATFGVSRKRDESEMAMFLESVHRANYMTWLFSVSSTPPNFDTIEIQSFIWLCERINNEDIHRYLDTLNANIYRALELSGLSYY